MEIQKMKTCAKQRERPHFQFRVCEARDDRPRCFDSHRLVVPTTVCLRKLLRLRVARIAPPSVHLPQRKHAQQRQQHRRQRYLRVHHLLHALAGKQELHLVRVAVALGHHPVTPVHAVAVAHAHRVRAHIHLRRVVTAAHRTLIFRALPGTVGIGAVDPVTAVHVIAVHRRRRSRARIHFALGFGHAAALLGFGFTTIRILSAHPCAAHTSAFGTGRVIQSVAVRRLAVVGVRRIAAARLGSGRRAVGGTRDPLTALPPHILGAVGLVHAVAHVVAAHAASRHGRAIGVFTAAPLTAFSARVLLAHHLIVRVAGAVTAIAAARLRGRQRTVGVLTLLPGAAHPGTRGAFVVVHAVAVRRLAVVRVRRIAAARRWRGHTAVRAPMAAVHIIAVVLRGALGAHRHFTLSVAHAAALVVAAIALVRAGIVGVLHAQALLRTGTVSQALIVVLLAVAAVRHQLLGAAAVLRLVIAIVDLLAHRLAVVVKHALEAVHALLIAHAIIVVMIVVVGRCTVGLHHVVVVVDPLTVLPSGLIVAVGDLVRVDALGRIVHAPVERHAAARVAWGVRVRAVKHARGRWRGLGRVVALVHARVISAAGGATADRLGLAVLAVLIALVTHKVAVAEEVPAAVLVRLART